MCEGASKPSLDLKNYTAPGPRPPVLKFLDPPLAWCYSRYVSEPSTLGPGYWVAAIRAAEDALQSCQVYQVKDQKFS